MFWDSFAGALDVLWDPTIWIFLAFGAVWGAFCGAMPGIGATLGYALVLPLTLALDPVVGVAMLLTISVGNQFGNSLPAITLAIPGGASTVMTVLDGNALYKQGKGDIALGAAYIAALAGQLVSIPLFVLLVIPLANLAYVFQPPELFAIYVLGMVTVISIASTNILKGLLSALFGLLIGLIGTDPLTSQPRFTFGLNSLRSGLDEAVVIVGLLAVGEIFRSLRQSYDWSAQGEVPKRIRLPRLKLMGGRDMIPALLGGTFLGTFIGAIPGAGNTTAALVSYQQAKLWSKKPEEFGKGSLTGIIANEAAQNAANAGELIPTMALGIPTSGSMLILLGALTAQGFIPGPFLIVDDPELLYAAIAGLLGGTIFLAFVGMRMATWVLKVSRIDRSSVMVGALALVVLGVYAFRSSVTDVMVMFVFGVIGYFMYRYGYSPAAMSLAVVLTRGFESTLRYGLALSDDSWSKLLFRPVTASILLLSLVILAGGLWREAKQRNRGLTTITPIDQAQD